MILESIDMQRVDFDKLYFNPGCALSVYKPEAEIKVLKMLQEFYSAKIKLHNICCHHNPNLPEGSTIINNCAGCDRRFRSLYKGIQTISLWEVLSALYDLPLPDYYGASISVHDSCSYRPNPQVHAAVRDILKKMNFKIFEAECHGTRSICCGDNFYPALSVEKVNELQRKRAAQMPCEEVAVYCVSCIKSMHIGGKKARHMVDLILNESTEVQTYQTDLWHDQVNAYIEAH